MKQLFYRFRPINLLIVAITQLAVYFMLVNPMHDAASIDLPNLYYYLITMITVLICAGGYVINDICDIEIDRVNKPNKVIQDAKIWINVYRLIFLIGLGLTVYLSYLDGSFLYTPIYILSYLSMYYYSTKLKCTALYGNLIVSIFSAGVVLVLLGPGFWSYLELDSEIKAYFIPFMLYAVMAFLVSLVREIVKDVQDVEGDRKQGCKTLAVTVGTEKAKIFAIFFGVILSVFLSVFAFHYYQESRMIWTIGLGFIGLWNLMLMILLIKETKFAKTVQSQLKLIMFIGLVLLLVEPYFNFLFGW